MIFLGIRIALRVVRKKSETPTCFSSYLICVPTER